MIESERDTRAQTAGLSSSTFGFGENVLLPFGHSTLSTRSRSPRPTTSGRPWGGHIYGRAGSPQSTTAHINRCSVVGPVGAGATLALVVYISRMGLHESGLGGPSGSRSHTLIETHSHTHTNTHTYRGEEQNTEKQHTHSHTHVIECRSSAQTNNPHSHTHTGCSV